MKILIGVHHFPPKYRGGAEWRAYRTASALRERGHHASVVCVEQMDADGYPLSYVDEIFQGVPVRRLSMNLAMAPEPLRWEYDNRWIGEHLQELFAAERPDLFHLISGYLLTGSALQIAQDAGIPTVLTLTDFWFLCRRISMLRTDGTISTLPIDPFRCARCLGEEKRRFQWLYHAAPVIMEQYWKAQNTYAGYFAARYDYLRHVISRVGAVISPSQFLKQMYVSAQMTAPRMLFLRQGHQFGSMTPDQLEKSTSSVLRIGYLGQIAHLKGVHVLVDAVRSMSQASLEVRLYGDPTMNPAYTAELQRKIGDDRRIKLMGVYERNQLTTILRDLDVVVVPSIWYENSPNVILEAFAHHTPVIASDFGGMAELVDNGKNGLRFLVGDVSALASVLKRLTCEPGLLSELSRGAANSTPPTIDQEIEQLIAVYESLINVSESQA